MKILLDTHVLLWALEDSPKLPLYVRDTLLDENNEIYVSSLSLWEIAIKHRNHPELMPFSATQIRDYAQRAGYIFLSLNFSHKSLTVSADKLVFPTPPFPAKAIILLAINASS